MGASAKNCNQFFGKRLKELRTEKGLTQSDIGKLVNKGDSTVRMWELRNSEPDYETVSILADYFGVSVDYLLGREEKGPANNGEANRDLNIPEKYSGIRVALNEGDRNLTQDDIDDIVRFIEFTANKNKK